MFVIFIFFCNVCFVFKVLLKCNHYSLVFEVCFADFEFLDGVEQEFYFEV